MERLQQLALNRIKGSLPVFVGATPEERLKNGRAAALASLKKYAPDGFKFDPERARLVMSQVNGWAERNKNDLSKAMESPGTSLPQYLVLNMGNAVRVQDWVIANYVIAALGLGPWMSGRVVREVQDPNSDISLAWAQADENYRLQSFAMIVKMDQDGDLKAIFEGPTEGMGVPAMVVWAIVVTVIGLAAVVVNYLFVSKRLEINNNLMREQCLRAQAEGDKATVEKCIEAAKELQEGDAWSGIVSEAGKVAMTLGAIYIGVRYALPWATEKLLEKAR